MGTLVEDAGTGAEWVAKALRSSGYLADFTPNSLVEIDRFFDENVRDGEPVPGGLLSEQCGQRLFAIGAYVGEVIRRNLGGEWKGEGSGPEAEMRLALHLTGDHVCWPIQRVLKRFELGFEEGHIAGYGVGLGLKLTVSIWPKRDHAENGHVISRPSPVTIPAKPINRTIRALVICFFITFFAGGLLIFVNNLIVKFLPEAFVETFGGILLIMLVVLIVIAKCVSVIQGMRRISRAASPGPDPPTEEPNDNE